MKIGLFAYLTIMSSLITSSTLRAQMGDMPGMNMETPQKGAATKPASGFQEPENATQRTGDDQPAPELLTEAARRAPLGLQQFEDWAQQNNPMLKRAAALKERSEQQARQAGLPPNPTIGYSGEHIRGGSYGGGEQGAFVQQTVVLGGKLRSRGDVYRAQAAADTIGMEEQTYAVRADVQSAFYRALAAQAVVDVRRRMLTLAADAAGNSHRLLNLGQADAPDVLQAEVEWEQAKVDYLASERMYLQNFAVLATLCNQPSLPVAMLAGDLESLPNLDGDVAVARLLASSPSVQRAQQQVAVADARVAAVKREAIPNLTVQAGEWYSGEQLNGINRPAGWMSFAQVGVELPLWNRNQGATAAAKADVARAQAELTETQLALKQQSEPLAQGYLTARFEAERYKTQLIPRAQRAHELYSMKYQQMAAAYPQVIASQRTLLTLQIAYLHALESAWLSAVSLQNYALGGVLGRSPEAPGGAE